MRKLLAATCIMLMGLASQLLLADNPKVEVETSEGNFVIELYPEKAPATVQNFLDYVNSGFYNGTVFHRVINGFMIQGGGFEPGMKKKNTNAPIPNEADNGLSNSEGTVAMARTNDPNSATAQFFINVANNKFLNHSSKTMRGWGYAVFGKVVSGMDVVNKIKGVETTTKGPYQNVPKKDVVITKAFVLAETPAQDAAGMAPNLPISNEPDRPQ